MSFTSNELTQADSPEIDPIVKSQVNDLLKDAFPDDFSEVDDPLEGIIGNEAYEPYMHYVTDDDDRVIGAGFLSRWKDHKLLSGEEAGSVVRLSDVVVAEGFRRQGVSNLIVKGLIQDGLKNLDFPEGVDPTLVVEVVPGKPYVMQSVLKQLQKLGFVCKKTEVSDTICGSDPESWFEEENGVVSALYTSQRTPKTPEQILKETGVNIPVAGELSARIQTDRFTFEYTGVGVEEFNTLAKEVGVSLVDNDGFVSMEGTQEQISQLINRLEISVTEETQIRVATTISRP